MTIDATGKEIVIGSQYGYSNNRNGFTRVITGSATKALNGKVTLANVTEKTYLYAADNREPRIKTPKNSRTIAAVQVFPIN